MLNIILSKCKNAEAVQFGSEVLDAINIAKPATIGLDKMFETFAGKHTALQKIFKSSQKNELTKKILEEDEYRDNILRSMFLIVDGYLIHWKAEQKLSANQVNELIEIFGRDLIKENYQSESAIITSLLKKIDDNPELGASIEMLHLNDHVAELRRSNNKVIKLLADRNLSQGDKKALPKIKLLRKELETIWNKLTVMIEAKKIEFEGDAKKEPLINTLYNTLEEIISKYNLIVKQRQADAKARAKKAKPAQPK